MKKKWWTLLIKIIILAITIAVTVYFISKTNKEQPEENEITNLIESTKENISKITIKDTETEIILENTGETWEMSNNHEYTLDEATIEEITTNIPTLQIYRTIEENPQNKENYGLQQPQAQITIQLKDNNQIQLDIGNKTPTENYYYTLNKNNSTVYLIQGEGIETIITASNKLTNTD